MSTKQTVAVVGLGTLQVCCVAIEHKLIEAGGMGLVTVKNLLEEGFDVTGFDGNAYLGGLWHFTEDEDTLSVLESECLEDGDTTIYANWIATQINISVDKVSLKSSGMSDN